MRRILYLVIMCTPFFVYAQTEPDIQSRLEKIYRGEIEEVREELPTLLTHYQNNPGVIYLHGMVTTDGTEAVKIFQSIVDNFPESEWADDALYRIYQYYYSVGLYRTAEQKLDQLKREYPNSRYIFGQHARVESRDETTEAELEQTAPQPPPQQPGSETRRLQPFALQVGAFSSYENAVRQRDMLSGLNQPIEITTRMRGGQNMYLVWLGSFRSRDQALEFAQQLRRQHNIEAMVVSR
jgi:tetratricopeptide (TPR) repeat protein